MLEATTSSAGAPASDDEAKPAGERTIERTSVAERLPITE